MTEIIINIDVLNLQCTVHAGNYKIRIYNKLCYIYGMTFFYAYFSNNYFTIVTMQEYFGVLYRYIIWQGNNAQALQKIYKYLLNHGSYGFLFKCVGLLTWHAN